jgi:TBC1 domain family member 5
MPDALRLWDCLFACDPSLDLARWICVAMLIRIRNECTFRRFNIYKLFTLIIVIPADYSGQLTTLLRYPSPPTSANKVEGAPHHTVLLLRQALALQIAPMPATGASIAMENRTFLNILLEVPTSSSMKRTTRPPSSSIGSEDSPSAARGHSRQVSSPAINLDMLTRGLVERGESLGINKTLLSAVTEIRVSVLTINYYGTKYLYFSGTFLSLRHHWVSGLPVSLFHHFLW